MTPQRRAAAQALGAACPAGRRFIGQLRPDSLWPGFWLPAVSRRSRTCDRRLFTARFQRNRCGRQPRPRAVPRHAARTPLHGLRVRTDRPAARDPRPFGGRRRVSADAGLPDLRRSYRRFRAQRQLRISRLLSRGFLPAGCGGPGGPARQRAGDPPASVRDRRAEGDSAGGRPAHL